MGDSPLFEPIMVCFQLYAKEHISVKFYLRFKSFHSRKCTIKRRVQTWRPSCRDLTLLTHGKVVRVFARCISYQSTWELGDQNRMSLYNIESETHRYNITAQKKYTYSYNWIPLILTLTLWCWNWHTTLIRLGEQTNEPSKEYNVLSLYTYILFDQSTEEKQTKIYCMWTWQLMFSWYHKKNMQMWRLTSGWYEYISFYNHIYINLVLVMA